MKNAPQIQCPEPLAEFLPEGIEDAATEEAITYYERKTSHRSRHPFEEYEHRAKRY